MIELRRIGLINWHLLPALDIDVAGDIGVIGENRSGKTTLLDLVQVVMTGNSGRYLRLNASANESGRKRGMRSVHAYCLGRLSPDKVTRPSGALSYVFLVFVDSDQPERVWTIGLALEASPSESSERTLGQFILHGHASSVADFLDRDADGSERVRDWALVRPWLEKMADQNGGKVYRDEPGKFVADYLKALSTGQRFVAVDQFMKAFVNAISFEQIPSATDFVRRYLLEDRPIRIGQLRESIATYQKLRKDVQDAKDKLARLGAMRVLIGSYKDDLAAHDRYRWIAARAHLDHQFAENRRLKARHREALAALAEARREIDEYDRLIAETKEELEGVQAAIHTQVAGSRKAQFEAERKAVAAERKDVLRDLQNLQQAVNLGSHVLKLRAALPASAAGTLDLIEQARTAGGTALLPAWPRDPQRLGAILDDRALDLASLREHCRRQSEAEIHAKGAATERKSDVERRIRDIGQKGFSLERNVEDLVAELAEMGFRPRILCTLLELVDETWRRAAEALLGRDREAILVDDEAVEEAIRHLQRNRQRFRGCRIVNTRKIDRTAVRPEPGTLASVLRSADPVAMAFVIRRIGNVRLAHTIEDLHRPGRAIMRDGTYDDGLAVEMRDPVGGDKIGAEAGRAGLGILQAECDQLSDRLEQIEGCIRELATADQALSVFAATLGKGGDVVRWCDELQRSQERLDRIAADIRALEQNVDPALQSRKAALDAQIATYHIEARDAAGRERDAKRTIGDVTQVLGSGEGQVGSALALRHAWNQYRGERRLMVRAGRRPAYHGALDAAGGDFARAAEAARKSAAQARERFERGQSLIFDRYVDYHTQFGLKPDFTREQARIVADIEPWVDANVQRIEEVDLVRYEDQAAEAAEKTRNFFQHSFAFELRERFDSLRQSTDEMNRTLSGHDFHYEQYRFVSHPVEMYRDIINLVEASRGDDSVFAHLFDAEVEHGHPHAKALRTVQELLLDETRDVAEFEDYRRYFAFNLIMKDTNTKREVDLETRRGTGSGAEQQVPFYVAIGTALAAAYHGKAASDPGRNKGIGLAVFDEAFSKLDGKNQKACMEYYEKLGLQVMVAAPFEKRATLYETMESFVETIRHGDVIDVEAYEIRDRTRKAFTEANPANMGLDEFRRLMAGVQMAD